MQQVFLLPATAQSNGFIFCFADVPIESRQRGIRAAIQTIEGCPGVINTQPLPLLLLSIKLSCGEKHRMDFITNLSTAKRT
ncbi:hypothetical protein DXT99_17855 [Pontibacter diazotrophicus]|uniref:Uncharacterized protein n=1 Tax=Pontibacter diazotrophicus TaxID=1400979 RepID=A0A3D8L908_9BACT|nr:hypothetical protein DXT99_17855 [Pontibacter diazotrophicus]